MGVRGDVLLNAGGKNGNISGSSSSGLVSLLLFLLLYAWVLSTFDLLCETQGVFLLAKSMGFKRLV